MTFADIAVQRLRNQGLEPPRFKDSSEVVSWFGAVQAQDYAAAKWALGLRSQNVTDADVEQAFTDGKILRTHVLRPTWHFVTPEDILWLLKLTAPRVNAVNAYMYRKLELDTAIFKRSYDVMAKALQGGKQLTRVELAALLQQVGIATDGELRMSYLMMRAELDGVVCSGARRGKQFTYALLGERAPHAKSLERDEALAELTRRYFTSHGPATLEDFVWWSGLTVADARIGLELAKTHLIHARIEEKIYWFAQNSPLKEVLPTAYLLPWFDEFLVSYKNRSAVLDPSCMKAVNAGGGLLNPTLIVNGQVVGTWKRTLKKDTVELTFNPFRPLNKIEKQSLAGAVERYGNFFGKQVFVYRT
jgi:Winged helix DNA-binding domain